MLNKANAWEECVMFDTEEFFFYKSCLRDKPVSQVWNYICILEFFLPEANSTPISHDGLGLHFSSTLTQDNIPTHNHCTGE